jgi:hypothetical protein
MAVTVVAMKILQRRKVCYCDCQCWSLFYREIAMFFTHTNVQNSFNVADTTDTPDHPDPAVDQRKTRPSFAPCKVARLKSVFLQQNYLSKPERRQLALELDMTEEQVKTWFQNKRTKLKKKISQVDEHYAKLLYLNDLINGTSLQQHHDYPASMSPHSYHGYPVADYPSLDRLPLSPEYSERLESFRLPYVTKY